MNDFDLLVKHCRYLLNNAQNAEPHLAYLNTRLGPEMQEKFNFGYFPGAKDINLLTNVVNKETLKRLELLYSKEINDSNAPKIFDFSYFEHHPLVMPYKNVYGKIIALVGRSLLDDEERKILHIDKYKNTRFTKGNHLFGLYEAMDSIMKFDFVYIVEGQFDVIKAFEKGLTNIVAIGNSSMSAYQFALICRYTKNILLLLDNDVAGEKGRERIMKKFKEYANINNVYLPKGYKDIDDYLKENDAESVSYLSRNVIF
jgi:DNA primase